MTTRFHWSLLLCAPILAGCNSISDFLPWEFAGQPSYTESELAAHSELRPAAARDQNVPALSQDEIMAVSSSTPAPTPTAASRVDQMIRTGQAAIRDAGQGDPTKLRQAQQVFEQVLAADPGNSSAHHRLAIVADLQQNWGPAEMHYKTALQQRPLDPSLLNDLGYSYLLQKRFHESSQYLNQAVQLSPQHERAHINLALLALTRGDRTLAEARLATIYAPAEVNATIARLEQDVAATANAANTAAPLINSVPQKWIPIRDAGPNSSGMTSQFQGGNNLQGPGVMQNAPRPHQPIHIYPSGVVTNDALNSAQLGAAGGGVTRQQGIPSATYPYPGQGLSAPGSGAGPGMAIGGVIEAPPNGTAARPISNSQFGSSAEYRHLSRGAIQQSGSGLQAPIAGLNAGPGIPFPVGVQAPVGTAPSVEQQQQQQHKQQLQSRAYPSGAAVRYPAAGVPAVTVSAQSLTVPQYPTVGTPAPVYGSNAGPGGMGVTNPAQAYEIQLQQLNNRYQQELQQLGANRSAFGPNP